MQTNTLTDLLQPILSSGRMREFKKGQGILYPGDPIEYVYLVKKGAITLSDIDDTGLVKILYIIGQGGVFPVMSLLGPRQSTASWFYEALVDTECVIIPYKDFYDYLHQPNSTIYSDFMNQFGQDVHELITRVNSLTSGNTLMKLSGTLKYLASKHSKGVAGTNWHRVKFPVSHQVLASMTGLTRETVTHHLGAIQKSGAIKYATHSRLTINCQKLKKLESAKSS